MSATNTEGDGGNRRSKDDQEDEENKKKYHEQGARPKEYTKKQSEEETEVSPKKSRKGKKDSSDGSTRKRQESAAHFELDKSPKRSFRKRKDDPTDRQPLQVTGTSLGISVSERKLPSPVKSPGKVKKTSQKKLPKNSQDGSEQPGQGVKWALVKLSPQPKPPRQQQSYSRALSEGVFVSRDGRRVFSEDSQGIRGGHGAVSGSQSLQGQPAGTPTKASIPTEQVPGFKDLYIQGHAMPPVPRDTSDDLMEHLQLAQTGQAEAEQGNVEEAGLVEAGAETHAKTINVYIPQVVFSDTSSSGSGEKADESCGNPPPNTPIPSEGEVAGQVTGGEGESGLSPVPEAGPKSPEESSNTSQAGAGAVSATETAYGTQSFPLPSSTEGNESSSTNSTDLSTLSSSAGGNSDGQSLNQSQNSGISSEVDSGNSSGEVDSGNSSGEDSSGDIF